MTPPQFLAQPEWHKTALVLLHFLWQGTLIAAVVAVLVRLPFIRRPETRYVCCLLGLAAMIAAPLVTCFMVESPSTTETGSTVIGVAANESGAVQAADEERFDPFEIDAPAGFSPALPPVTGANGELATSPQADEAEAIAATSLPVVFTAARPYLVLCWLTGVILLSGRMLLGFVAVCRLRRRREQVPASLVLTSRKLCRRFGLAGYPEIAASRDVAESFALGFLRPLVLLPAAWLIELPPDALQAVIAHELAHIRRRDLWVNLLQRVVEAVLFYHPAVWWLSGRIRAERELCCDLLAVGVTGRRVVYARTLEFVARRRVVPRQPVFATGMGGKKMALLDRVRNVLGVKHSEGKLGWWSAGVIALAIPVLLWVVSSAFRPALADDDKDRDGDRVAAKGDDDDGQRGEQKEEEGDRSDGDRERGDAERRDGDRGDRERGERDRPDRERREGERRDADRREGDRPREGRDLSDPDQARDFAREREEDRRRLRDEDRGDRDDADRDERNLSREELLRIIAQLRRELAASRRGFPGPREGERPGPRPGGPRPDGERPRFDRPFEGRPPIARGDDDRERREGEGPPRIRRDGEGERPGPRDGEGPPRLRREGDRPPLRRPEGREGDRPPIEGRPDVPRGDRPRLEGRGPGVGPLNAEVINLIRELRGEVERLRREVNELRGRRGEEGERREAGERREQGERGAEGDNRDEGESTPRKRRNVERDQDETERGERRESDTEESATQAG